MKAFSGMLGGMNLASFSNITFVNNSYLFTYLFI